MKNGDQQFEIQADNYQESTISVDVGGARSDKTKLGKTSAVTPPPGSAGPFGDGGESA